MAKATHFKFSMHINRVDQNKSASKQSGKSIHRCSQAVSKTFRALIYLAHHAVIFAIAQLSCTNTDRITVLSVSYFIDSVNASRPNPHKIGHFGDALPSQSVG